MNIEEIKKQAEEFLSNLGSLDDEAGFLDGVNFALDKCTQLIEEACREQRQLCLDNAEIAQMYNGKTLEIYISRLSILNASSPIREK